MILKLSNLDPLYKALSELDGNPPFKFSAKLTWNKARNLSTLGKRLELLGKTRNDMIKPMLSDGQNEIPKERIPEFVFAWSEMMEVEEDIPLLTLDPQGLNIFDPDSNPEGNVIPATVLERLMPLFDGNLPP